MPYKDPEKRKEVMRKSLAQYCAAYTVRVKNCESNMNDALVNAADSSSMTPAEYLRLAAKEKLIRDGFLTKEE